MTVKKRFTLSLALSLVFTVLLSLCGVEARCDTVKRDVLRLHILANSDSDFDQQLKIAVRDKVQQTVNTAFAGAKSKNDALKAAQSALPQIISAAQAVVDESGADYRVNAEVTKCAFNTREYDSFTLPAGVYDAVRITLGKGEGHNWWCVLYPRVCVAAATDISEGLETNAAEMVTSKNEYRLRFGIIELCERLKSSCKAAGGGVR